MNKIKKLRNQEKNYYLRYLINGEFYRAYEVGNIPSKFGCVNWKEGNGISEWLIAPKLGNGHGGLTFISEDYFPKWS